MRCVVVAAALAACAIATLPRAAMADTSGSIITDETGADAIAVNDQGKQGSRSGTGEEECEYRRLAIDDDQVVYQPNGDPIEVDGTGHWYEKWCGSVYIGAVYLTTINPLDLLAEARQRLDLPLLQPQLSPTTEQLVNLSTWLWIDPADWTTRSATAAVPGVSVTVTATPAEAIWAMGDGAIVPCAAGTPYSLAIPAAEQSTDCSHTYERASAGQPEQSYAASLTIRWRLSWTVSGAAGGGDLGTVDRTTTFSVPVAEVQTVNTNAGAHP